MPRCLIDLTLECLDTPNLFRLGKTVTVIGPDGGPKRIPVMQLQSNIWSRYFNPDLPLSRPGDAWMVEKIDNAISTWKRGKAIRG